MLWPSLLHYFGTLSIESFVEEEGGEIDRVVEWNGGRVGAIHIMLFA